MAGCLLAQLNSRRIFRSASVHFILRSVFRRLSILFYGTDDFSLHSLKCLQKQSNVDTDTKSVEITNLEVVCKDKNLPVGSFAEEHGLSIHLWPYEVPVGKYDVGIVVSFGYLIPQESIYACKHGMVNVHPSLLPRWRGAAPIHHTLINGDAVTGVSVVDVAPHRFDVGRILLEEKYPVPPRATLDELTSQLAAKGGELLLRCLADLPGHKQRSQPQATTGTTKATKVHPKMGKVSWSTMTAHQVDCLFRGLPFPLFTFWKGKKIKLLFMVPCEEASNSYKLVESAIAKSESKPKAGTIIFSKKAARTLAVLTVDGKWVNFQKVVYDGVLISVKTFHRCYVSKLPPEERFFEDELVNSCQGDSFIK